MKTSVDQQLVIIKDLKLLDLRMVDQYQKNGSADAIGQISDSAKRNK